MRSNEDKLDFKSKEEIKASQEIALQKQILYLYANSPFYKNLFDTHKIDPSSIKNISDLSQIPATSKNDLDKNNNNFQCVPSNKIVEYVTTSGTLGDPIIIALTKNDLDRLAYNEKRSLQIAGVTGNDIVQLTTTLDKMFMAGMAYYTGTISLGASVIRSGISNPSPQWKIISRFNPTVTITVPSFLYKLAKFGSSNGINPNESSLKKAICIGEPIRNKDFTPNKLQQKIIGQWNIELYSTYASTEMMTAFTECSEQKACQQLPELIIVEILDDNGKPVEDGQLGEVTVTPLGVEGTPVLRYRTGDLARAYSDKCGCGRNTIRLGPVEGRKNQMMKFKGTTLFPQSIEEVLQSFDEIGNYVIEISKNTIDTDSIRIYVADNISDKLVKNIKLELADTIRVTPELKRVTKTILASMLHPEGARKPMRIRDNRAY